MKTIQQQETEAILSMVENMKALEQQLADAKNRIDSLEKVIANQRAMINELQWIPYLKIIISEQIQPSLAGNMQSVERW